MKTQIITLGLLLSLSGSIYAADAIATNDTTVLQDIQNTETIDGLIEKMNQAPQEERYKYMNEIKDRISTQKGKDREEKMAEVLGNMNQEKEYNQEHMNQETENQNNHGNDDKGYEGSSDSTNGGSSGEMSGGSDHGGGSGGEMGGGSDHGGGSGGEMGGGSDHGGGSGGGMGRD